MKKVDISYLISDLNSSGIDSVVPLSSEGGNSLASMKAVFKDGTIFHVKIINKSDSDIPHFKSFLARHPEIANDRRFALPSALIETDEDRVLVVSPWVEHRKTLADELMDLWLTQNQNEIQEVSCDFGQFMASLITDYQGRVSHNDCTPSNVLLTESGFVLVDCLGMDDDRANDDMNSFLRAIDFLSTIWDPEFVQIVCDGFTAGVNTRVGIFSAACHSRESR